MIGIGVPNGSRCAKNTSCGCVGDDGLLAIRDFVATFGMNGR
jgi:hypothetical protein